MVGFPEIFVKAKLQCALIFGQKLRRYTGLNHLVQAAREVLKNGDHVLRMQQDYEKVDFVRRLCLLGFVVRWCFPLPASSRTKTSAFAGGVPVHLRHSVAWLIVALSLFWMAAASQSAVQKQVMDVCDGCSTEAIGRHEAKFKDFQRNDCTITKWAGWLQGVSVWLQLHWPMCSHCLPSLRWPRSAPTRLLPTRSGILELTYVLSILPPAPLSCTDCGRVHGRI